MKKLTSKHHISGLFALLAFCVFAVCVLLVLLTGARTYRALTARDEESYSRSICVRYVAAKVRHAETAEGVFIGDFSGRDLTGNSGDTLFLTEKDDGELYYTRIYFYDGYIRELYTLASGSFEPKDGNPVMKGENLSFKLDETGTLLTVFSTDENGKKADLTLLLHCKGGNAA